MNRVMSVCAAAIFLIAAGLQPLGVPVSQTVAASQLDFSVGGVIVFTKLSEDQTQDENVVAEIYIMTPDGLNQRRITTNSHFDIGAELSPDGRTVAFHQGHDDHCCTIQLVDIDGANERTLVAGLWPSWSPDGRRIAFNAPGVGGVGDIWTIGADGTGLTNLTRTASGESRPDWSPNGQKIAFGSNRSGNMDLWVMDADGSNPVQVTNHPSSDAAADWSPSGQQILFQSGRCDPRVDVFVIDADGLDDPNYDCSEESPLTDVKRLTRSLGRDLDPNWSPDGQQIVFDSDRNYIVEQIRQVFIMNADGSDQTPITQPPHEDGHASWSHGPLSAVARSISPVTGGARGAEVELPPSLIARLGLAAPFPAFSVSAPVRHPDATDRTRERIARVK